MHFRILRCDAVVGLGNPALELEPFRPDAVAIGLAGEPDVGIDCEEDDEVGHDASEHLLVERPHRAHSQASAAPLVGERRVVGPVRQDERSPPEFWRHHPPDELRPRRREQRCLRPVREVLRVQEQTADLLPDPGAAGFSHHHDVLTGRREMFRHGPHHRRLPGALHPLESDVGTGHSPSERRDPRIQVMASPASRSARRSLSSSGSPRNCARTAHRVPSPTPAPSSPGQHDDRPDGVAHRPGNDVVEGGGPHCGEGERARAGPDGRRRRARRRYGRVCRR
jgi:hypothetical protein